MHSPAPHAAFPAGIVEAMLWGMDQGFPEGMPQGLNEGMTDGITEAMRQAILQGLREAVCEAIPEAMLDAIPQAIAEAMHEAFAQASQKAMTVTMKPAMKATMDSRFQVLDFGFAGRRPKGSIFDFRFWIDGSSESPVLYRNQRSPAPVFRDALLLTEWPVSV
jgi:hypothetical protein